MAKKLEINSVTPSIRIAVFKGKEIRKSLHNNEWWFSVVDIVAALTDSIDPGAYWRKLKERLKGEGSEVVTNCHGLKLPAVDGKLRETDCANTEGIFRIIQSIPSPKAEPFKRWLAKVGYERVQESESRGYCFMLRPNPRPSMRGEGFCTVRRGQYPRHCPIRRFLRPDRHG